MKPQYIELGIELERLRKRSGLNVAAVAKLVGVDRTYIHKLEKGTERPSSKILSLLISHLSPSNTDIARLRILSGYVNIPGLVITQQGKGVTAGMSKEVPFGFSERISTFNQEAANQPRPGLQLNMPIDRPALYSDSVFVTTSQFGVLFDFAQSVGNTDQQNVVARIGMSKDHAKALLDVLKQRLEESEK